MAKAMTTSEPRLTQSLQLRELPRAPVRPLAAGFQGTLCPPTVLARLSAAQRVRAPKVLLTMTYAAGVHGAPRPRVPLQRCVRARPSPSPPRPERLGAVAGASSARGPVQGSLLKPAPTPTPGSACPWPSFACTRVPLRARWQSKGNTLRRVNVSLGRPEDRMLLTGLHTVRCAEACSRHVLRRQADEAPCRRAGTRCAPPATRCWAGNMCAPPAARAAPPPARAARLGHLFCGPNAERHNACAGAPRSVHGSQVKSTRLGSTYWRRAVL